MLKIFIALIIMSVLPSPFYTLQAQNYSWINGGPFGGMIRTLAINSVDTNIVYAGTYGHGIFKSENGGFSWTEVSNGLSTWPEPHIGSPTQASWWFGDYYPVNTIKIDPENPYHLWAGTEGGGLAYSHDGGENWEISTIGLTDSSKVFVMNISRDDPSFLFAGVNPPSGGLYKSTDGGLQWVSVDSIPRSYIWSIAQHPDSNDIFYVGRDYQLLKTTDRGENWEILHEGLSPYNLTFNPNSPLQMWGVMYNGWGQRYIYMSTNGGLDWTPQHITSYQPIVLYLFADIFSDPIVLYAYTIYPLQLYKSNDEGVTWDSIGVGLPDLFYLAINPLHPNVIYAASNRGLHRSNDGGENFTLQVEGMINTYIRDVAIHPQNPSIAYAGGIQGLWKTTDAGQNWQRLRNQSIWAIAIDPQYPDTLYVGTGGGMLRSYDGGNTWDHINPGLGAKTAVAIHPDSTNIIFAGAYPSTIYKSTNRGQNWTISFSTGGSLLINHIAINPHLPNIAFFGHGGTDGGLYKTTNGGGNWREVLGLGTLAITFDPTNETTVYIVTNSDVKVSYDYGENFTSIKGNISSYRMSDIAIDSNHPNKLYVASMDHGIFYSVNEGQSWENITGINDPRITSLALFSGSPNWLNVGTHGSGVWVGEETPNSIDPNIEEKYLSENFILRPAYPNPFNPITNIEYQLFKPGKVDLKIYTILGEELISLVSDYQRKGIYTVTWNGKDSGGKAVSSGIYLIVLRFQKVSKVNKLIFLK